MVDLQDLGAPPLQDEKWTTVRKKRPTAYDSFTPEDFPALEEHPLCRRDLSPEGLLERFANSFKPLEGDIDL